VRPLTSLNPCHLNVQHVPQGGAATEEGSGQLLRAAAACRGGAVAVPVVGRDGAKACTPHGHTPPEGAIGSYTEAGSWRGEGRKYTDTGSFKREVVTSKLAPGGEKDATEHGNWRQEGGCYTAAGFLR
jgi:hypothetical protein